MGIKTVAVYSEADALSRHVDEADEAVFIGAAPSAESYLRIDKILEACQRTGAEVVHPGYGFLSENSKFVAALEGAGIAFAGPPPSAMEAMGDKINSKRIALEAKVNTIPGFVGEIVTPEEAIQMCRDIGYPVMIKASAGGGGKGMRVAWNDDEARDGFLLAKAEARASFGDDRMLIEKFIHKPRHVEIQVLADSHGTTLYLNERECSIQRRNQKVYEEAPSPFLDPDTRRQMGEQAVALARAVGYRSAGTVEMLIDSNRNFYFLEMNTRLQVEHPITELITGQDIVEHMINIAAGRPLPIKQEDLVPRGWATEARIYAEDPLKGFLPSIGRLTRYKEPPQYLTIPSGEKVYVRCDAGVVEGSEISVFYDPLISKLITYGSTREASIEGMKRALDRYIIRGFNNNVCFLRELLDHPKYIAGGLTTSFIPENYPEGFKGVVLSPLQKKQLLSVAALTHMSHGGEAASTSDQLRMSEALQQQDRLTYYIRIGRPSEFPTMHDGFSKVVIAVGEDEDSYELIIDDQLVTVHEAICEDSLCSGVLEGVDFTTQFIKALDSGYQFQHCGTTFDVTVYSPKEHELSTHIHKKVVKDMSAFVISPMPGSVISVAVRPGDHVKPGQKLLVLEAMKMQNSIQSPTDAIVKTVYVQTGDRVGVDQPLIEFEEKKKA